MHSPRAALKLQNGIKTQSFRNLIQPATTHDQNEGDAYPHSLPTDPKELMRQILMMKRAKDSGSVSLLSKNDDSIDRADADRAAVECKLMFFEDILCSQVEASLREADFKRKIRKEADDRKLAEAAERERRKAEAEIRRQAVVERIRAKQEAEARARREEEERIKRIKEEQEREVERQKQILRQNREGFATEDELSRLNEMDYREELGRKQWREKERLRLAAWEAEQAAKDAVEAAEREKRQAALDEKKRRLQELKQQQQQSDPSASYGSSIALTLAQQQAQAQEEAAKLSKQMRIQNKAKFVTKKLKAGTSAQEAVAGPGGASATANNSVVDLLQLQQQALQQQQQAQPQTAFTAPTTPLVPLNIPINSDSVTATDITEPEPELTIPAEWLEKLKNQWNEMDVKAIQKQVMAEKRAIRLQQQQNVTADPKEVKNLRARLAILMKMEEQVTLKLAELSKQKKATAKATETAAAVVPVVPVQETGAQTEKIVETTQPQQVLAVSDVSIGPVSPVPAPQQSPPSDQSDDAIIKRAEQLLHQGQQYLSTSNNSNNNNNNNKQMLLCALEMAECVKHIHAHMDRLDYRDKLHKLGAELKSRALMKPEPLTATEAPVETKTAPKTENSTALAINMDKIIEARPPSAKARVPSARRSSAPPPQEDAPLVMKQAAAEAAAQPSPIVKIREQSAEPQPVRAQQQPQAQEQPQELDRTPSPEKAAVPVPQLVTDSTQRNTTKAPSPTPTQPSELAPTQAPPAQTPAQPEPKTASVSEKEKDELAEFADLPGWEECLQTHMHTAAHHAAYYGYSQVLELLVQVFDCFIVDSKGRTPLFYACLGGQLKCVCACLSVSAGCAWVDVGDEAGDTCLHAVCACNSNRFANEDGIGDSEAVSVLRFLLEACECSADTANYEGVTPSHVATSPQLLQVLYEHGAMPYCVDTHSRMPLHWACQAGRVECVKFLCSVTPPNYLLWGDTEGTTCLHEAASHGHAACVTAVCAFTTTVEQVCVCNHKGHTAAHVAANADVLRALYEQGCNLWITDSKNHYPLFLAAFFGRTDCVAFLIDIAMNTHTVTDTQTHTTHKLDHITHCDAQGDSALHAAALKGNMYCVELLLYYVRNHQNNHGITPSQLATRTGNIRIANMIDFYSSQFGHVYATSHADIHTQAEAVFECTFDMLSSVLLSYGSRWTKLFDVTHRAAYYYDRITGVSSWEEPSCFDIPPQIEEKDNQARDLLISFYDKYNPTKLSDINDIQFVYRNRYTELFISLANKYEIEDLSMFAGISFEE